MKQFEITEAQEWQLFELLEGNLSADESALLHQEIEAQPALAYHFNLLKQTYTSAPQIHFPEAQSLKKQEELLNPNAKCPRRPIMTELVQSDKNRKG